MVVISFLSRAKVLFGVVAMLGGLAVSQPALANSASAAADMTAPLRSAPVARTTQGDSEFHDLFNDWKSLDGASLAMSVPDDIDAGATMIFNPTAVSIPSQMPVQGASLTSGYGMRVHPVLGGRRQHKGVDLAEPMGSPVYATADGVVSKAEWFSSYGLFISLEHGANIQTRYGHLSQLNVAAGQMVKKGDLIGFVGSTGRSTGPHLHYEVRIAGTAVDPIPYLQGTVTRAPETSAPGTVVALGDGDDVE